MVFLSAVNIGYLKWNPKSWIHEMHLNLSSQKPNISLIAILPNLSVMIRDRSARAGPFPFDDRDEVLSLSLDVAQRFCRHGGSSSGSILSIGNNAAASYTAFCRKALACNDNDVVVRGLARRLIRNGKSNPAILAQALLRVTCSKYFILVAYYLAMAMTRYLAKKTYHL